MRANCWTASKTVELQHVPDPMILNQRDCIVRITSTAICGSDLHLYNGVVPFLEAGGEPRPHHNWGGGGGGARGEEPQGGRPGSGPLSDRLRQLQCLPGRGLLALRELQPQCVDPREAVR